MANENGISDSEMRKFRATLAKYAEVNKRTFKDIVNSKALDVAFKSLALTEKADADKVAATLGQVATGTIKDRKTGMLKKGRRIYDSSEASFAARIINKRLRDQGKKMLWGDALAAAVKKFINARLRSIAFIRSGFLPAIRQLSRVNKDASMRKMVGSLARQFGQDKGRAIPATETYQPAAYIINSAFKGSTKAETVAHKGTVAALHAVRADMLVYIKSHLKPINERFSGK